MEIGAELKVLRKARGLSLRALSERSGVTVGALSQIENNNSSPSVGTLRRILAALDSSMGEFFSAVETGGGSGNGGVVYRKHELMRVSANNGLNLFTLPQGEELRAIQMIHETYEPGADTGPELYTHDGEECGYCIEGTIELTVDGRVELLSAGDSYYFKSTQPHRFRNVGQKKAIVLSACTPPTF
ncbi:MAG: cupin domain-containing protein [Opitutales bacterium]